APQSPVSQGSPKGQTTAPQSPVSQGSPKGQTTAPQSPVSQGSPKGQTTAPQSPQGAEGGASSQSGDLSTQRNVASGSASFPPVGARKMTSPGSATRSLTERYGRSAAARYPSREELTKAWGDGILASLGSKARIRFKPGRFVEGDEGTATFALPSKTQLSVCEPYREEVQSALNSHFSVKFDLVLVCDTEPSVIGDAPKGAASKTTRGPVKHADQPKQPSPPEHDTDSEEAILSNPGDLLDEDGARARAEELVVTQFPGAIEIT
ncbi:MAG TPA: hypothetical protein VMU77_04755, partial [Acidimicrobiales bacterium]|nr:hypothetical protein [Acidimicrobiales bacterium]